MACTVWPGARCTRAALGAERPKAVTEFFATKDHKGFVNFVFSSEIFVFCGASRGTLKTLNFGTLHAPTRSVCSVTAFGRSVCSVVDSVPPLLPRWHGFYHNGTDTACFYHNGTDTACGGH